MWDKLDQYLTSTNILTLDISSSYYNTNTFGKDVAVSDGGNYCPPLVTVQPQYAIVTFSEKGKLIFIKCTKVHPIYELCSILLAPNSTAIRLSHKYYEDPAVAYHIPTGTNERDYHNYGELEHFIDYKLYIKLRHFRNLYDVHYLGEEK